MNKEEIILTKHDKVYFENARHPMIIYNNRNETIEELEKINKTKILKIERPIEYQRVPKEIFGDYPYLVIQPTKYETIYDVTKQILNKKIKPNQNQKAIECLKEVKEYISTNIFYVVIEEDISGKEINQFIDNKIKELEKGDE